MSAIGPEPAGTFAQPPYLFPTPGPGFGALVTVAADFDTAIVEIGVHGRWSRRLGVDVSAAIGKCLVEPPAGIIADLYDLGDPDGASMLLWLAARRAASVLQPPVEFALCLPTATALNHQIRRAGVAPHLPRFATMAEARAAVSRRMAPAPRLQADLPPHLECAGVARDLVVRAGDTWNVPEPLLMRAKLVMSELVVNAVEHAGSDIRVTVSHRGIGLHLAVCDGVSRLPRPRHPLPAARGRTVAPARDRTRRRPRRGRRLGCDAHSPGQDRLGRHPPTPRRVTSPRPRRASLPGRYVRSCCRLCGSVTRAFATSVSRRLCFRA
ncbi:ATP-binding protein [Actinoplanes sp. CA-252034]|uniref:ATP-binding protein n=1 Tax=Actinoplanes sp. CA-252034 TaxID=3239906 RepID=UPI003D984949